MINTLGFIISLLRLLSLDIIIGIILFLIWKYLDLKYFSTFEITRLKEENTYLKNENKKINGTSNNFWSD